MGLTVDNVASYVAQNNTVQFMKENDYATVKKDDAQRIHEFLNNKDARKARQTELTNYLLGMKDDKGNVLFSQKEAEAAAHLQVQNEMSQKRAQVTIPFIDRDEYNAAVAAAKKDGTEGLYNFRLIEDKDLLKNINDHPEKFYKTDDNGKVIKDANGKMQFDPDKFKAEFGQDVGTDNKLQLAERETAAHTRQISTNAEKNAIKAMGLDYRRDNTGLYRTLAGTAALAAIAFGSATAIADAVSTGAAAHAAASAKIGSIIGGAGLLGSALVIHDKDGKTNKRQDAADLFAQKPENEPAPSVKLEPVDGVSVLPKFEPKIDDIELSIETPCYNLEKGVTVDTIKFGGYWHYANLYNDCQTGKPLTSKQIRELTNLLKPGHEGSSIQKGDNYKTKVLQNEITLKDGTKVCLADKEERDRRIAQMVTHDGGKNFKLENQHISVKTCDGKTLGTAKNAENAHRIGIQYQNQNQRITFKKKAS